MKYSGKSGREVLDQDITKRTYRETSGTLETSDSRKLKNTGKRALAHYILLKTFTHSLSENELSLNRPSKMLVI